MMNQKRCDNCGNILPKRKRRFCCNTCKDRFHNWINPRGKFAHLHESDHFDPDDDIHPHEQDAYG